MESEVQENGEFDLRQFAEAEADLERTWRGRGIDWFLQDLVRWANKVNLSFGLTLHTPAGVVSGTVISHEAYFKEFAGQFAGPWAGESEDSVRSMISGFGEPRPHEDGADADFQFIHLKDAKFFTPGQVPMPNHGVLWRGKISSVCSFHLGKFETS